MRYRFRGLLRDTGKPVEGHVEAPSVDQAYALMGDNNIVCESLREDPRLGDFTRAEDAPTSDGGGDGNGDDFTNAIDSALDTSSTQVNVDDLWRKYRGQRVRVIDRDKIRNRVMSVVSKAMLGGGGAGGAGESQTLQRVEEALTKMFGDNQNLTSEISAGQAAAQAAGPPSAQMGQLTDMVLDLQKSMAELKALVRKGGGGWGGGGGGGGGRRGAMIKSIKDPKNDKVLLEIFETNVKLQKGAAERHGGGGAAAAIAAAGAPTKSGPSEAAKRLAAQSRARDDAKKAARPD